MASLFKAFLFILILTNIGAAEIPTKLYHGFPSFTISSYMNSPIVNNGDKVSINFFFSGAGDVDDNKLWVSIPPYLVKESVEVKDFIYDKVKNEPTLPVHSHFVDNQFTTTLLETDFKYNWGEFQVLDNGTKYAPLTVYFTVDDDAPAGDHDITTTLFYKNGTQWYMSEKITKIHIRYWYERELFQYLVFFSIFIVIIEFLYKFFNKTKLPDTSKRT